MNRRSPLKAWLVVLGLLFGCSQTPEIVVQNAWVRLPVPGRDVMVGYFEIHNATREPVTVTRAHSPDARAVEMHTMMTDGDMMRMRPLGPFTVTPGERVRFAPGGHHLMIFGATATAGGHLTITFELDDGRTLDAAFEVRPFEGAHSS